jgi:hypothetical protein
MIMSVISIRTYVQKIVILRNRLKIVHTVFVAYRERLMDFFTTGPWLPKPTVIKIDC